MLIKEFKIEQHEGEWLSIEVTRENGGIVMFELHPDLLLVEPLVVTAEQINNCWSFSTGQIEKERKNALKKPKKTRS